MKNKLNRENGLMYEFDEHGTALVTFHDHRVLLLDSGNIIRISSNRLVFADASKPYTRTIKQHIGKYVEVLTIRSIGKSLGGRQLWEAGVSFSKVDEK